MSPFLVWKLFWITHTPFTISIMLKFDKTKTFGSLSSSLFLSVVVVPVVPPSAILRWWRQRTKQDRSSTRHPRLLWPWEYGGGNNNVDDNVGILSWDHSSYFSSQHVYNIDGDDDGNVDGRWPVSSWSLLLSWMFIYGSVCVGGRSEVTPSIGSHLKNIDYSSSSYLSDDNNNDISNKDRYNDNSSNYGLLSPRNRGICRHRNCRCLCQSISNDDNNSDDA